MVRVSVRVGFNKISHSLHIINVFNVISTKRFFHCSHGCFVYATVVHKHTHGGEEADGGHKPVCYILNHLLPICFIA